MNAGTLFRLLLVVTLLTGCSQSPRDALLQMSFPQDKTRTVGDVFAKYPYFKNGHWRDYRDEHNREVVEYQAEIDLDKANIALDGNQRSTLSFTATTTATFVLHKDKLGFELVSIDYEEKNIGSNDVSFKISRHANNSLDPSAVEEVGLKRLGESADDYRLRVIGRQAYARADAEYDQQVLLEFIDKVLSGKVFHLIRVRLSVRNPR